MASGVIPDQENTGAVPARPRGSFRVKVLHVASLSAALFAFWFMLSGRTDPEHLIIGAASSVGIAVIYRPLVLFSWRGRPRQETHPFWELPWLRLLGYLPYLSWEIIRANIQVAILILSPRLPIQPSMVEFEKRLPGPVAQLILAHSITLTPGTVTVDVVGDRFLIHALWEKAARGLVPEGREGEMPTRVGALFGLNPEWSAGGPGQADDAAPACGGGSRS